MVLDLRSAMSSLPAMIRFVSSFVLPIAERQLGLNGPVDRRQIGHRSGDCADVVGDRLATVRRQRNLDCPPHSSCEAQEKKILLEVR